MEIFNPRIFKIGLPPIGDNFPPTNEDDDSNFDSTDHPGYPLGHDHRNSDFDNLAEIQLFNLLHNWV